MLLRFYFDLINMLVTPSAITRNLLSDGNPTHTHKTTRIFILNAENYTHLSIDLTICFSIPHC